MPRPKQALTPRGVPARILDRLETEDQWLTVAELVLRLDAKEEAVSRALPRLRDRGLVHSRFIAGPRGPAGYTEWRHGPGESTGVPAGRPKTPIGRGFPLGIRPKKKYGPVQVWCKCGTRGVANAALLKGPKKTVESCPECR